MAKIQELFDRKIRKYQSKDVQGYLACARELTQQMALFGLYRSGFNKVVAFHGGTALRILYDLDRYSEDLDFCLLQSDMSFKLSEVLDPMVTELNPHYS